VGPWQWPLAGRVPRHAAGHISPPLALRGRRIFPAKCGRARAGNEWGRPRVATHPYLPCPRVSSALRAWALLRRVRVGRVKTPTDAHATASETALLTGRSQRPLPISSSPLPRTRPNSTQSQPPLTEDTVATQSGAPLVTATTRHSRPSSQPPLKLVTPTSGAELPQLTAAPPSLLPSRSSALPQALAMAARLGAPGPAPPSPGLLGRSAHRTGPSRDASEEGEEEEGEQEKGPLERTLDPEAREELASA